MLDKTPQLCVVSLNQFELHQRQGVAHPVKIMCQFPSAGFGVVSRFLEELESMPRVRSASRKSDRRLYTALEFDEPPVRTVRTRHHDRVASHLPDLTVFQEHDSIGLPDGGQAMRDDDHQPALGRLP